nr:unnamed protein product [Naegleria fowleri]
MLRLASKITRLTLESKNKQVTQAKKMIGQADASKKSIKTEIIGCTVILQCINNDGAAVELQEKNSSQHVMKKMFDKFQDLKTWHEWSSPLHSKAYFHKNQKTNTLSIGTKFSQDLNLGFPIGSKTSHECITGLISSEEQCTIQWSKEEGGLASCHIWSFDCLSSTQLQITNVEVFHGIPMVLVRPLVSKKWNQLFEQSLEGFLKEFNVVTNQVEVE